MDEVSMAIAAFLAANTTFLISYLAYISPKCEQYRVKRRHLLNRKLKSTVDESKTKEITIDSFLPLFKEYEIIEKWGNNVKQICLYLGYSIFLVSIGLFVCLIDYMITLAGIRVEVIFVIGGGIYFLFGLYAIVSHVIEVNEWKVSKKIE